MEIVRQLRNEWGGAMCLHFNKLALTVPLELIFIYVLFKSISITV